MDLRALAVGWLTIVASAVLTVATIMIAQPFPDFASVGAMLAMATASIAALSILILPIGLLAWVMLRPATRRVWGSDIMSKRVCTTAVVFGAGLMFVSFSGIAAHFVVWLWIVFMPTAFAALFSWWLFRTELPVAQSSRGPSTQ